MNEDVRIFSKLWLSVKETQAMWMERVSTGWYERKPDYQRMLS